MRYSEDVGFGYSMGFECVGSWFWKVFWLSGCLWVLYRDGRAIWRKIDGGVRVRGRFFEGLEFF